ncbi:hypothetical protein PMAYCL1PPCAC_30601, partial [Pristionchus mayeri]
YFIAFVFKYIHANVYNSIHYLEGDMHKGLKYGELFWNRRQHLFRTILHLRETVAYLLPICDLPYSFDVIRSHILVLKVVRVLPHINSEQRHQSCSRLKRILVGHRRNTKLLAFGAHSEPAPSRTLQTDSSSAQSILHFIHRSEISFDCCQKFLRRLSSILTHHLKKNTVIQVTACIELECGLERYKLGRLTFKGSVVNLLLNHVQVGHVGIVVLLVVKLHYLRRDNGLESIEVIGKIRESVLRKP